MSEAAQRIRETLEGLPKEFVRVKVGERADGQAVHGHAKHLADVAAGDVVEVCSLVPVDKITQVVKDLHKGCSRWNPEREVQCQARCLWHLLKQAGFEHLTCDKPPTKAPIVMTDTLGPDPKATEPLATKAGQKA